MKLKFYTLLIAISAMWTLNGCDNDDDSIKVPSLIQEAFSAKYPNITNMKWETKSGYYVADFHNGYESSAWFTSDGKWQMTETDIPYTALPDPIKSSFEGQFNADKSWKVDDVDKVEREGVETVYVIEVEKQNQEIDLYYSAEGILIKEVADNDNDTDDEYLPTTQLTAAMEKLINEKYAGAKIMEVDVEDDRNDWDFGFTEVDIIHQGTSREVKFDKSGNWYSTSWEVYILTTEVLNAINNEINNKYPGYKIDDSTDYFEMADGTTYYLVELEKNNAPDVTIKVAPNGTIL